MGPALPGGMSFTVNRVPFAGGDVPSTRAPMSSIFTPTEMSAGARSVHQMRVEAPPDFEIRLLDAVASMRTFAVRFASCPVTTRRTEGESVTVRGFELQATRDETMKSFPPPFEITSVYASAGEPSTPIGAGLAAVRFEDC